MNRLQLPENVRKKRSRLSPEQKMHVESRKKNIQQEFKDKMGLLVDMPKPGKQSLSC